MKEQKGKRRVLSRDARRRMGEAGFKNLAQYKARINTRAIELEADVNSYREGLLRDAGSNLTTTKAGLIEAAVTTYAALLKIRHQVIHSRRRDEIVLTERVSWLTSNLARLLKQLDLDRKPRPRSLEEALAMKAEEDRRNRGQNGPVSKGSGQKASESGGKPAC